MKKLKTFAFCTLLAALAANHTPATAANGPTGDAAPATRNSEPKMYAWEQERDAIPSYTDLVLCTMRIETRKAPSAVERQRASITR